MRCAPVPFGDPVGWGPVNHLLEGGCTRDTWAHRIDLHAVIGRPMELDPAHDARLVADIVREWAELHGSPFVLCLTGTAAARSARARAASTSRWKRSTSSAPFPGGFLASG